MPDLYDSLILFSGVDSTALQFCTPGYYYFLDIALNCRSHDDNWNLKVT